MKKVIYSILTFAALSLASCESFTDVQPKGKNLLTTTDQLEMLLNQEFSGCATDMRVIAGDMIYAYSNLATEINKPTKTRAVIMWTWDESNQDKMAELTSSDADYSDLYKYIGTISNPILTQLPSASGTDAAKNQLKCEALTLRAWSHYLLVNKFAKAYNPATAATDRGIVIMTEDKNITEAQAQSTVKEVYDQIVKDADEAISLGGLPDKAVNKMRMCKPAAYAVKALALLNMQDWDGAEEAAKQAIAINGTVNDYFNNYQSTTTGYMIGETYDIIDRGEKGTDEDYFINCNYEFYNAYIPETVANFEEGHVYKDRVANMDMAYDYLVDAGEDMLGETGFWFTYDLSSRWNDSGLRAPQMYLTIAECELHKGNIETSMEYLDKVRQLRIDPEVYEPLAGNVTDEEDAIAHLKQAAMNEDIFSVNVFIDKKRWNQLDGWKATYSRTLAGTTYSITPDSKMWIFPFPKNAMNNNSQLKQNYKD